MTKYKPDLNSWSAIYDYLSDLYLTRESKYISSNDVYKPDVIVPKENVRDASNMSEFRSTDLSFDMESVYNLRDKSFRCSVQVRKYEDGKQLYSGISSSKNIYLGTSIKDDIRELDKQLYHIQLDWRNPEKTPHNDIEQSVRALIGHLFLDVLGHNVAGVFRQCCADDMKI